MLSHLGGGGGGGAGWVSRISTGQRIFKEAGLYAEILQRQGELGVFKKEGGAAASSVQGSTGRQCLKN